MRSPVTDLIQRFNALNEVEQKVFLDQVDPQPEPEPEVPAKKAASVTRKGRCAACDYAKVAPIHHDATLVGYHVYQPTPRSARAASISAAIAKTPKVESETGSTTLDADTPKCGICGNVPDHSDHDPTYLSSHVFEAPKGKRSKAASGD